MDAFTETLRSWQNFYFMTGGAAATLLGLMFVALSLGMHLVTDETKADIEFFASPSVFYFTSALLLSGAMLVPSYTPLVFALLLALWGVAGLGRTIYYVRHLFRAARQHQDFTLADWLPQVVLPLAHYVLLLTAALCFAIGVWSFGFFGLWLATILLLISAISNAWSMVLWIINQQKD